MIFMTAKANRSDPDTGLPVVNYVILDSIAEVGPYIGWMFSHGRTGCRRHYVNDFEELREEIKESYRFDEFQLVEVTEESP